jgi:hypothetical protein
VSNEQVVGTTPSWRLTSMPSGWADLTGCPQTITYDGHLVDGIAPTRRGDWR